MSELSVWSRGWDGGLAGLRMTAEEYLALGDTGDRYQLLDGVVIMHPRPSSRHQRVMRRLLAQLDQACEQLPGLEALSEYDLVLGRGLVYQPDIAVFAAGRFREGEHSIVPDLVIEILSPGSKALDLITKRQDYERCGVGEYLVIDPGDGEIRRWVMVCARYEEQAVRGDHLEMRSIPGVVLDLGALRP